MLSSLAECSTLNLVLILAIILSNLITLLFENYLDHKCKEACDRTGVHEIPGSTLGWLARFVGLTHPDRPPSGKEMIMTTMQRQVPTASATDDLAARIFKLLLDLRSGVSPAQDFATSIGPAMVDMTEIARELKADPVEVWNAFAYQLGQFGKQLNVTPAPAPATPPPAVS